MDLVLPGGPALIVCRQVEVDPASGLPTLVDVRQDLVVHALPTVIPRLTAWIELHDGLGTMSVTLSVNRPADSLAGVLRLFEWHAQVTFTKPRQVRTLVIDIRLLPLVGPGDVEFHLAIGEAVIMRRVVPVSRRLPGTN
jgi:hypothetical protein